MPTHAQLLKQFAGTWEHRIITAADPYSPEGMALRSAIFGPEIEAMAGAYPFALKGDIVRQDNEFWIAIVWYQSPHDARVASAKLDHFQDRLARAMDRANVTDDERAMLQGYLKAWWQHDERDPEVAKAMEVRARMPKTGAHQWNPKTREWDRIDPKSLN